MHCSWVAAAQYHCCVVDRQCRARALTLPRTRLDPPVGLQSIHAHSRTPPTPRGTPMLPWSTNQFKVIGSRMAHGTVAYKGLIAVHDSSISFTVTHWLSCTAPV